MELNTRMVVALRLFKNYYPDEYKAILKQHAKFYLRDWTLIKPIYAHLLSGFEAPQENMHIVYGVLLRLFDPINHYAGERNEAGLRLWLCMATGHNTGPAINHYKKCLSAHEKNPRFIARIERLAVDIVEEFAAPNQIGVYSFKIK